MARKRRKFWRALKAVATGGLSEVKNKRAIGALLTGGLSEAARTKVGRGILTGGASVVTQSSVNLIRGKKLKRKLFR